MGVVMMLSGAEEGHINWAVIVFGNLFVCLMEGLIVGIQVLRLEYYEIFSRFYQGGGTEFRPYRHRTKHIGLKEVFTMNTLTKLVLIAALILSVLIPFGYYLFLRDPSDCRSGYALSRKSAGGFGLRQSIGGDRISGSGSFHRSFRHRRRNCRGQCRKRCSRRHQ